MAYKKPLQFLFFRAALSNYAIRIEEVSEILIPGQDFRVDFSTDGATRKYQTGGKTYNGFSLTEDEPRSTLPSHVNCRLILLEPSRMGNVLIADSVEGILRVDKAEIQAFSGKRRDKAKEYISGMFMDKGEMVQIIEPRKMFAAVRAR